MKGHAQVPELDRQRNPHKSGSIPTPLAPDDSGSGNAVSTINSIIRQIWPVNLADYTLAKEYRWAPPFQQNAALARENRR